MGEEKQMKDIIFEKLRTIERAENKLNVLREFLQCLTLKSIEEKGYFRNIAFVGGTALRFLYGLRRFSEDLDFSLIAKENFDFGSFLSELTKTFAGWNIEVEAKEKSVRTVYGAFLKFPGVMYDAQISGRKDQKLMIKIEVDSNPPKGWRTESSFSQKYFPVNILHYDKPSLCAGKLHAVLYRQYAKGRDFYDLMWFLGEKVTPNFPQLENAIYQTTKEKPSLDMKLIGNMLLKKFAEVDFQKIQDELARFVEEGTDAKFVTREHLEQMVKQFLFDRLTP